MWYYRRRRSLLLAEQAQAQVGAHAETPNGAESSVPAPAVPTAPLAELHQPILKRKRRERLARRYDPLNHLDWLALSPRIAVNEEGIPAGSQELDEMMMPTKGEKDWTIIGLRI